MTLEGLDDVAWHSIDHAYGPALDTPGHVRALLSSDPEVVERAITDLDRTVHEEGGFVCGAATAVLPFLVEVLPSLAPAPRARLLVSAATRPDADVILRGLTGDLELFLATGSFEMGYDEVLEHVLWLVGPKDFDGIDLVLALVDVLPWRTEALDYLRRLFERDTTDVGLVVPFVPVWIADPDVRLRAFAVWLAGVARAREYRDLVAERVHDHGVTSLGQKVSTLATTVLLELG